MSSWRQISSFYAGLPSPFGIAVNATFVLVNEYIKQQQVQKFHRRQFTMDQKKKPSTSTERSSQWHFRFKSTDPIGYEAWKRQRADKMKDYRRKVQEENGKRLQIARAHSTNRQKKFRDKQKALVENKPTDTIKTETELLQKTEEDRPEEDSGTVAKIPVTSTDIKANEEDEKLRS